MHIVPAGSKRPGDGHRIRSQHLIWVGEECAVAKQESVVEVEGRQIKLSNLEKVLYPKTGFTKGQVIDYYVRIAPVLLPHLSGRPLTLKRYPNGVDGMHFYEKNCPKYRPEWMKTARVWSRSNNRFMDYCVVDGLPTLVWLGNLADLELHTSLARAPEVQRPTVIAFDLDPGAPANIVQCCQVALWIREIFASFGLVAVAKTSGSKGLQIYVPLHSKTSYNITKPFAHALARLLEDEHRDLIVSDMKKAVRTNKVFVDWSQNDEHKTTIAVYSLRARERPTVSTPVSWDEVERALKKKDPGLLVFEAPQVLARVEKMGDLFEPVLKRKQTLPKLPGVEKAAAETIAQGLETRSSGRSPLSQKWRDLRHPRSIVEPRAVRPSARRRKV